MEMLQRILYSITMTMSYCSFLAMAYSQDAGRIFGESIPINGATAPKRAVDIGLVSRQRGPGRPSTLPAEPLRGRTQVLVLDSGTAPVGIWQPSATSRLAPSSPAPQRLRPQFLCISIPAEFASFASSHHRNNCARYA